LKTNLQIISRLLLNLLLYSLSYITPKNEELILLGSGKGGSFKGNPKYLYLYANREREVKNRFQFVWITQNRTILKKLKDEGYPVVDKYSLKGFWTILRSSNLVIEQSAKDVSYLGVLNGRFNIIQTWHGTLFKKVAFDAKKVDQEKTLLTRIFDYFLNKEFNNYIFICSASEETSSKLIPAFRNNNVVITGYPRNDIFYSNEISFNDVFKILSLGSYERVVVYAPTFREIATCKGPFSDTLLVRLNSFLADNNYIMLIKKHPFEKVLVSITGYSNIKDVSKEVDDVQELLAYTDILITDYSSVYFDYSLTDKPIIYYPYDYKGYLKNCREFYYDYYEEQPGPFAHTEEELLVLLKDINDWFNDEGYRIKYRNFKNKYNHFQDGNSSERTYQIIIDLLNSRKSAGKLE